MGTEKRTNYWEYIRVEELLSLQGGLGEESAELSNDEVLFITVHQVFELWFQLVLRELRGLRDLFHAPVVEEQALSDAVRGIRRVITILRRCVDHFEVIETLTTREYLGFRDKLMPASGFQSAQLREIEILLGLEAADRIPLGTSESWIDALRAHDGSESSASRRVERALADGPTLLAVLEDWLYRTPIDGVGPDDPGAAEALDAFVASYLEAHAAEVATSLEMALERALCEEDQARLRKRYAGETEAIGAFLNPPESEGGARRRRIRAAALFLLSYRELPLLAWPREILDGLIEFEQVFVSFRQRHARMVERVIGRRTGTGGSSGVDYLDATALAYRIFRDLWAVRTYQIRREANPPLTRPEEYGFRRG
ncbi:MAG TPA: tryptophan 2,3-dioxygenase [Planctomycetes bacterium]|nr:tryptophan 2,3-dioxygenase [Planctomycetota bacterium]